MTSAADPRAPPSGQPAEREREWPFFIGCALGGLAGIGGLLFLILFVFWFGEDLVGSSRGAIDDYNRDALNAMQLPADATLVQTRVYEETLPDGTVIRYLARLYVTGLSYDEVRNHFQSRPQPQYGGLTVEFLPAGSRWPKQGAPTPIPGVSPDPNETVFVLKAGQEVVKGVF